MLFVFCEEKKKKRPSVEKQDVRELGDVAKGHEPGWLLGAQPLTRGGGGSTWCSAKPQGVALQGPVREAHPGVAAQMRGTALAAHRRPPKEVVSFVALSHFSLLQTRKTRCRERGSELPRVTQRGGRVL